MPPETLSTALVTPRIGSNLCELLMPPIIGVKSAGKRCEWEWEMLATLERANSVAHSSNWQKSVSHDTFILTDQLGCPSLQKGEGGEEGRLPLSLSPFLFLSPPFLNNAPPSPSIRSPPVVPSGVICVALPPAIAVRPGRSCVHPLAAGRHATLVNQQVVVVVVTVVAEDDLDEGTGRKG